MNKPLLVSWSPGQASKIPPGVGPIFKGPCEQRLASICRVTPMQFWQRFEGVCLLEHAESAYVCARTAARLQARDMMSQGLFQDRYVVIFGHDAWYALTGTKTTSKPFFWHDALIFKSYVAYCPHPNTRSGSSHWWNNSENSLKATRAFRRLYEYEIKPQ